MPKATNESDRRPAYGTEAQVAAYLGLARITAQTWRLKKRDFPPAYKFGKRVMYKWVEVEEWADSHRTEDPK